MLVILLALLVLLTVHGSYVHNIAPSCAAFLTALDAVIYKTIHASVLQSTCRISTS